MGMYQHVRKAWTKPKQNLGSLWKERLIEWRRDPVTLRIERPTRIDRARELGYRAKQGIIVVRQRVQRGGKMRPDDMKGRRPKHSRRKLVVGKNYRQICEERCARKYPNCEVLNSYYVAQDGKFYWYEIILVDRDSPSILRDKTLSWLFKGQHTKRVHRGLTSAGRRSRGLHKKGKGSEKTRPGSRANNRKIN